MSNAINLDLKDWGKYCQQFDLDLLFVTVSGAHIYGFPSADSDVDLRGSHRLPLEKIVGLTRPNQTFQRDDIRNGIEVDLVTHEVAKYFGLLVKNNGYILEQIFSPIVVLGQDFLDSLRPIAKQCITKNHYYHYRGFYQSQMKLINNQNPVTVKAVLYAYRVLATGIHLLKSGEVVMDLRRLSDEQGICNVPELISAKLAEKIEFKFDLNEHLKRLEQLEQKLDLAFENSDLPENPERTAVNDLLVQLRLGNR